MADGQRQLNRMEHFAWRPSLFVDSQFVPFSVDFVGAVEESHINVEFRILSEKEGGWMIDSSKYKKINQLLFGQWNNNDTLGEIFNFFQAYWSQNIILRSICPTHCREMCSVVNPKIQAL